MILRMFRHKPTGIHADSTGEKVIRVMMLLLCIGLAGWGFWANGKRQAQIMNADRRVQDELNVFTNAQKDEIRAILIACEEKYKIKFSIKTSAKPIASIDAPPESVFIGVSPNVEQVVILMPNFWRNTLGNEFIYDLRNNVMPPYFKDKNWAEGLIKILKMLEDRFNNIDSGLS